MSTAVMSNPMFEYSELLFKNTTKSKDPTLITTPTNCNNINVSTTVSANVAYSNVSTCNKNVSTTSNSNSNNNTSNSNNNNNNNNNSNNNNNNNNNSTNSNNSSSNGHAPLRRSYTSLVTTLIEQHRKLDRSVSEPTSRYKTELCRPFEESGACKYGDKCQFAHGNNELRNLARHPKYKTELCRTFHTIGFCPYGPRCHFIHNFEEAPIHIQKVCAQLVTTTQPLNIMGLNPLLSAAAAAAASRCNNTTSQTNPGATNTTSGNLNVSLLEQIAAAPQMVAAAAAAAAAASTPAVAAAAAATPNLMRTNSLNLGTNNNSVTAVTAGPTTGAGAYNNSPPPLLRTNSLSLASTTATSGPHHHAQQQQTQQQQHHHHHHHHLANPSAAISVIGGTRPKPLNLSPTFSLGSTGDSISPSSSLSQSPTNSMASFFSDDCLSQQQQQQQQPSATTAPLPTTASPFGFGQDFGLLAPRQTPSPQAMAACGVVAAAAAGRWRDPCQWSSEDVVTSRTPSPLSPNAESRLPVFNWISNTLSDFDNLKI